MTQGKKKKISQAQIAKEIGCSQALVSMALNGHTKGVSEKTYHAIRELAANQGYTPKGMKIEPGMAELQQRTVGYILRAPLKLANKSNFFSHIHQGLHEHLKEQHIKTIYLGNEDDITGSYSELLTHFPASVSGIAIMGEVAPDFLEKIREVERPIVSISARATGQCHSVLSNELESGELLVDHLYQLGHRNFAWIGGGTPKGRHDDRLHALQVALEKRALQLAPNHKVTLGGADRNDGYEAASQILAQGKPVPTAWICLNALMARGAMNQLMQRQIVVGPEISIAAFDMTRICEEERPTLTSAGADPEDMGREAARILLNAVEAGAKGLTDLTLPAKLVTRESTHPVKT